MEGTRRVLLRSPAGGFSPARRQAVSGAAVHAAVQRGPVAAPFAIPATGSLREAAVKRAASRESRGRGDWRPLVGRPHGRAETAPCRGDRNPSAASGQPPPRQRPPPQQRMAPRQRAIPFYPVFLIPAATPAIVTINACSTRASGSPPRSSCARERCSSSACNTFSGSVYTLRSAIDSAIHG